MEYVDIVDENDNLIGKTSKKEAHQKGLLHRTVIAEVVNSKGEWLLVKQAGHKQDPGQFVSPVGGHIASGEKVEKALKREAFEEVGLRDFTYEYVGKAIYRRKWKVGVENHYFIVYKIYSDEEPMLNDESVEYRRFTVEEIRKILKENPKFFGYAFHFVAENFFPKLFIHQKTRSV